MTYSLMIHGGAGSFDRIFAEDRSEPYLESMRRIVEHGRNRFEAGASALDVAEACTSLLEDDPLFNAGRGSVLNEHGKVEMDAAIMDGHDLSAGAVAGITNIANPVQLSRLVLAHSDHVMLSAEGANRFAAHHNVKEIPDSHFLTDERRQQFEKAREKDRAALDHDDIPPDEKFGTVGCVARDADGNLAAATSTGGITNKKYGRIGDSPIIGAGVYADNETCAISATGYGEDFMRTVLAKRISDSIDLLGLDVPQAVEQAMVYLEQKVKGRGGVIAINRHGACAAGLTTKRMVRGWIENGGETRVSF